MHILKLSEIQNNQPLVLLGLMGSPASGKSTLCHILTGKKTQTHSKELINGCSIKMGFANLKIYDDDKFIYSSKVLDKKLVKHISIADNPGHNLYMLNVLTCCSKLDYVLFLVAIDNGIDFQTDQHLRILKLLNVDFSFLISKTDLKPNKNDIKNLRNSIYIELNNKNFNEEFIPNVIPYNINYNFDVICDLLYNIKLPNFKINDHSKFSIIRSFDISKSMCDYTNVEPGVIGGIIEQGLFKVNDYIMILPGKYEKVINCLGDEVVNYKPYITKIINIQTEGSNIDYAIKGGFIALQTTLDPSLFKDDKMVGNYVYKIYNNNSKMNLIFDNVIFTDKINCKKCDLNYINTELNILNCDLYINSKVHKCKIIENSNNYEFILNDVIYLEQNTNIILINNNMSIDILGLFNKYTCYEYNTELQYKNIIEYNNEEYYELIDDLNHTPIEIDDNYYIDTFKYITNEFSINYPVLFIDKDDSSLKLTNIYEIFTIFNSNKNIKKYITKFCEFLLTNIPNLKKAKFNICDKLVCFTGVKRGTRINLSNVNGLLATFLYTNYNCNVCNTKLSLFLDNTFICKKCNATSMHKI